jgi:pimeloyl-ACP methyl ester carboxylesterase
MIILKFLKWTGIILISVLAIGFVTEQFIQLYFNTKKPAANTFYSINGNQIHFVKKGNGGPTVVFQSGLGSDYKIWEAIQDSLSAYTTTLSYDRAGLLWSDASKAPKTIESITDELQQLLQKTNCPKPYIFVGHSLAGITLRPIIRNNQKDVAGIIFVDVSHPLQIKNSSAELKKLLVVPPAWFISILVETGVARLYFSFKSFITDVPVNNRMNKHIRNYFYTSYKTFLKEAIQDDQMFEQAGHINSFGNTPLTIITGAYPDNAAFIGNPTLAKEYLNLHRTQQKNLLNLSTHSKQVIAPNSGHYVQLQNPEVIIKAIKEYLPVNSLAQFQK